MHTARQAPGLQPANMVHTCQDSRWGPKLWACEGPRPWGNHFRASY